MLRTNIFLEESQHQVVMELARQEKTTFSGLIREMIDEGIWARKKEQWQRAAERISNERGSD